MKKSIVLGLALVAFANVSFAANSNFVNTTENVVFMKPSPLCAAIFKGDFETVKKFVEYGYNVNEMNEDMTPLMFAARYNKVEIIQYLLDKGADKSRQNEKGYTALNYAEMSKAVDAVALLKK